MSYALLPLTCRMVKLHTTNIIRLAMKSWVSSAAISPFHIVAVILCLLGVVFLHFWIHLPSHIFYGHLTACIFECHSWHLVGLCHLSSSLLLTHLLFFLLKCTMNSFKNDLEYWQKKLRVALSFFLLLFQCFSTGIIS